MILLLLKVGLTVFFYNTNSIAGEVGLDNNARNADLLKQFVGFTNTIHRGVHDVAKTK